jgi:hypothetical protein
MEGVDTTSEREAVREQETWGDGNRSHPRAGCDRAWILFTAGCVRVFVDDTCRLRARAGD